MLVSAQEVTSLSAVLHSGKGPNLFHRTTLQKYSVTLLINVTHGQIASFRFNIDHN